MLINRYKVKKEISLSMSVFQRNIVIVCLAGILLTGYDVLLHALWVIAHISFEWFELGLENAIHRLFHTSRKQSQLIVFYLFFLMALYACYRLYCALPIGWQNAKNQCYLTYWRGRARWHCYQREHAKKLIRIKQLLYCAIALVSMAFFLTN